MADLVCIKRDGAHDVGGLLNQELSNNGKIDISDKPLQLWEYQIHALLVILASNKPPYLTTDELRRVVEALEPEAYLTWGYYEKWASAFTTILLERGVITENELEDVLAGDEVSANAGAEEIAPRFREGQYVKVRDEDTRLRWRRPHLRCPGYIFGLVGKVKHYIGSFDDPFRLAFRAKGPKQPLYTISFPMKSIWSTRTELQRIAQQPWREELFDEDCIEAEVYQEWLEAFNPTNLGRNDEGKPRLAVPVSTGFDATDHVEGSATPDSFIADLPTHHDLTHSYDGEDALQNDPTLRMIRSTDSQESPRFVHHLVHSKGAADDEHRPDHHNHQIENHNISILSMVNNASESGSFDEEDDHHDNHNHNNDHDHDHTNCNEKGQDHPHDRGHDLKRINKVLGKDLRVLSEKDTIDVLTRLGFSNEEAERLGRWDRIHLIRSMVKELGEKGLDEIEKGLINLDLEETVEGHDLDHDHDHSHENRIVVEVRAVESEGESDTPGKVIGRALLKLLYQKQVITPQQIAKVVDSLENAGKRLLGAELVARAWKDPAFKARLIHDATAAGYEVGISTSNPNAPTVLRVVENTATLHNVIVCTLCSCYPSSVLGLSPSWYKSRNYRARIVREPRKVLEEFGLVLPPSTRIVVHDSTADCRYLVLPLPPKELREERIQQLSIDELKTFISRDSLIGVAIL